MKRYILIVAKLLILIAIIAFLAWWVSTDSGPWFSEWGGRER